MHRSSGSDSGLGGNLSELEPRLERIVAAPGEQLSKGILDLEQICQECSFE